MNVVLLNRTSPNFLMGQPHEMQHIGSCYPSRSCQHHMCFRPLPAFPCHFSWPLNRSKKTYCILWSFTNVVSIPRPIWGSEGLVDPTLTHHISHFFLSQRIIIFNYISFIQSNCFIQSSHWLWHFSFWTEISSSTLYIYSFILICYISSQFF